LQSVFAERQKSGKSSSKTPQQLAEDQRKTSADQAEYGASRPSIEFLKKHKASLLNAAVRQVMNEQGVDVYHLSSPSSSSSPSDLSSFSSSPSPLKSASSSSSLVLNKALSSDRLPLPLVPPSPSSLFFLYHSALQPYATSLKPMPRGLSSSSDLSELLSAQEALQSFELRMSTALSLIKEAQLTPSDSAWLQIGRFNWRLQHIKERQRQVKLMISERSVRGQIEMYLKQHYSS
jgi:hypothetical protein